MARRARLIKALAMTGVAASAVSTVGLVPAARTTPRTGCAQVVFYGVKGSGENGSSTPMGPTVTALAAGVRGDLAGTARMTTVPVSYPAVSVFAAIDGGLLNGVNYPTSRTEGVTAVGSLVTAQLVRCPATKVVLAGFSQGADVVASYLASGLPGLVISHIAAVALFGDPRFNPKDTAVDAGSFNRAYGPIFGKFPVPPQLTHREGARPLVPAALRGKTISVCDKGDPVCGYTWTNAVRCFKISAWASFYASVLAHVVVPVPELRSSCPHFGYRNPGPAVITKGGNVTDTAAGHFVAARIDAALGHWQADKAPLPAGAASNPQTVISSVACPSAHACLAVGFYADTTQSYQGLLLTSSGSTWSAVKAPLPAGAAHLPDAELASVACVSATRCVVAGTFTDSSGADQGLLLTGWGTRWKAVKAPMPGDALADPDPYFAPGSVACAAGGECLVAATYFTAPGYQASLLTGLGQSWTSVRAKLPAGASETDVESGFVSACASPGNCVAAGTYVDSAYAVHGLLLTGWGTTWQSAQAPMPADAAPGSSNQLTIASATCASATACLAAGEYTDKAGRGRGLLLTGWKAAWKAAGLPGTAADIGLESAACPSANECAAVGINWGWSYLVTGWRTRWTVIQAPAPPDAAQPPYVPFERLIVACPVATTCVAAGTYTNTHNNGGNLGMVLTGWGTTWAPAKTPLPVGARSQAGIEIDALACGSPENCAAVGSYTDSHGTPQGLLLTGPI